MYRPTPTQLSTDSTAILNGIRNSIGGEFRDATPLVTSQSDRVAYGMYVTGAGHLQNQFMNTLLNKIARSICLIRSYKNHLAKFKRGVLEDGDVIENIWTDLCECEGYTQVPESPGDLYAVNNPDARVSYHPVNQQIVYRRTRNEATLRMAITNDLYGFIAKIVEQFMSSIELDEEIMTIYTFDRAILENWDNITVNVPAITSDNSTKLIEIMKQTSLDLEWMNPDHTPAGVPAHSSIENQYFFLTNRISAIVDTNALAMAYNLEYRQFLGQREPIKSFLLDDFQQARLDHIMAETVANGNVPSYTPFTSEERAKLARIAAATVDKDFLFIFDRLFKMGSVYDDLHMNNNIFAHVWKTYSYNPFAQIVVYVEPAG